MIFQTATFSEDRFPGYRRYAVFCAIVFCVLNWTGTGQSEEIRRQTWDGVQLDELVRIRIRGQEFQIPAGYFAPWPNKPELKSTIERQGIRFNFWMPDRRYVEINDLELVRFRPNEPGRYQSSSETFVVRVLSMHPTKPDELGYRSPEAGFKNLTSWPSPSSYSLTEEAFGLVRFWRHGLHGSPFPQPEAFNNYKHIEGSDLQVLLKCTPPSRDVGIGNRTCDGDIYSIRDELFLHIMFERRDLPRWRDSVVSAIELYKSWQARPH